MNGDTKLTELIDIEAAAKMMGQCVSTLRWWRANDKGPKSAKMGRRIMYRKSDIENWIEQQFANA